MSPSAARSFVERNSPTVASPRLATRLTAIVIVAALVACRSLTAAGIETWTGASTNNWSDAGNWTGTNLPPLAGDTLVFGSSLVTSTNNDYIAGTSFGGLTFSTGANAFTLGGNSIALTGALTDNVAANGVTETINMAIAGTSTSSLVFGSDGSGGNSLALGTSDSFGSMSVLSNSATANSLNIGANTLTINGGFSMNGTGATNAAFNAVGNGGTLAFNTTTGNFLIGTASATETASMDMSQLSNFSFNASTTGAFRVAFSGAITCTFTLANTTNAITAATFSVADSNGQNGRTTTFSFNGSTTINAGTITFGNSKGNANVGFTGSTPVGSAANPALKIRAQNGTGAATVNIGTGTSGTGHGSGTLDLTKHYIDISAGTLTLASLNGGNTANNTGTNSATLSFDDGIINATTVTLANQSSTGSGNSTAVLNVGSANNTNTASLIVGSGGLNFTSNTNTANSTGLNTLTGTLDINTGGLVQVSTDILKVTASTTSHPTIAKLILDGGTLNMQGHAIGPTNAIDTITMPTGSETATISNLGGTGINGAGLTMNGTGTLILTGSNSFTGGTTVSSGTLRVNGSVSGGDTTVNSGGTAGGTGTYGNVIVQGGTFTAGSATATGSVTAANLTVNSGATELKFSGSNADLIALTGTTGLTNNQIMIGQLSTVTAGSYLVLTSSGPLSNITPGLLTTIGRTSYTIDNAAFAANPNQITIDVGGAPASLKWTGADAMNPTQWDNSQTAANWQRTDGGTSDATHFYDADNVVFDGTNSGASILISGTVTPGSIAVTAGTYTIGGGSIAGNGPVTVGGTASLTLAGFNTMSGPVNVNGGTLNIDTSSAAGNGPITIGGGTVNLDAAFALNNTNTITINSGTLNLNESSGTALGSGQVTIAGGTIDNTSGVAVTLANNPPLSIGGSFSFAGAADGSHDLNVGTGAVALTASPTITVSAGTLTIEGTVSGSNRSLTKDGNGTLILDNSALAANNTDNSYSGGATVNAGTLQVRRKTSGRTPLGSGNTTVNAGGILIGGNSDAFGFANGVSPPTIFINGGTVTDLPNSSYRITLQDINFTGGTLTSDPTNLGGVDGNQVLSNYSLNVGTIETNAATTTAVISAATVSLQHGVITFSVAPGMVTGGATPGVDLAVSSALVNYNLNGTTITNGSLNKTGAGVMLLTGSSTYTGATTVSNGTLRLASSTVNNNIPNSVAINVNSGATLDVSGVTTVATTAGFTLASDQTLSNKGAVIGSVDAATSSIATGTGTYGPVVLDGGIFTAGSATTIGTVAAATLTVNSGSVQFKFSGSNADLINLAGSTNLTNAGISIGQLSLVTTGSYLVLTSGSSLTGITPGTFQSVGRVSYSVDAAALIANPNQLTIDVAGTPATLRWTGADSANNPAQWNNMQTDANWQRTDGGTNDPTHFYDLDNVLFDGTNTGPSNLTVSGTVTPGSINVSAGTYSFGGTGTIAGSGALVVSGTGRLAITIDNSAFSGPVNVMNGGTLSVADPNVNGGGSGSLGAGPINVDGTLFYNRSDSVTLTNVLSGAGAIHQSGTGTLILSGGNTFSGNFSIESGILQAGSAAAFNTTTPASVLFPANVPPSTTLRLNGFGVTIGGLNSDAANPGGATVDDTSTTAATLTVKSAASNTFGGVLQDGGTGKLNLTMSGGGTLLLSGTNNFSGLTIINGGSTIQTATADNLVGLAGQVNFNVGTLHITGDPSNPGTVIVAANTTNKFSNSGNSGATGTFNIDSGVTFQVGATAAQGTAVLQTAGTGPNGSSTAGSSFIKTGGGTMIIYGQNNQQDTSFRLQQGTIDLRSARGLGGQDSNAVRLDMSDGTTLILDADPGFANVTVPPPAGLTGTDFLTGLRSATAGGTINITVDQLTAGAANSQAFGAMQAAGAFTMNVASGPNMTSGTAGLFLDQNPGQTGGGFNGAVALSGDGTFNVINNATTGVAMQMTINGAVTGGFGLIKNGNGSLTLDSASTYTGVTTVNNGTLRTATAAGTIGAGPLAINAAAGVTSTVSLANSQSLQSLTTATDPAGLAVVDIASGSTLSVTGASSIQGNLSKTSAGTLVVGGTSSLAMGSAVQVNGGTLRVNVSGSPVVGAAVTATVAGGATLELDGTTSALTDSTTTTNRVNITNSGNLNVGNTVVTPATIQRVGAIDGTGTTTVADGSQLTANHIIQAALVIGSAGASPSVVTIAASDSSGNPLSTSGALAVADSLAPSGPFAAASDTGSSLLGADNLPAGSALSSGSGAAVGGAAAVPEPATFVLAAFAALAGLLIRLRR